MSTIYEYNELLRSRGIQLKMLGIGDLALEQSDALNAVELLRQALIPILGGDVYFRRRCVIELAYANWHSDPLPNESRQNFANRSCHEVMNYIKKFPPSKDTLLFTLVINE